MTVGNFNPYLGSLQVDPVVDSYFADDNNNNLQANNLDIVYGLAGGDNLTTNDIDFTSSDIAILVGGSGGDNYLVRNDSKVIIADNGNSNEDSIAVSGTADLSQFLTIDNSHLYLFDRDTDTYLLLLDYREPANQIEFIEPGDGRIRTYDEYITEVDNAIDNVNSGFLGNFTFAELQNSSDIPQEARIDLDSLGLSPNVNTKIQEIEDTANNFEDTIASLENIDGDLSDRDNSYIFKGDEYFYDLYSIDGNVFGTGDIANITLTSEDFNSLLFVLDSRGNVLDVDTNTSDNSSQLSFIVGSGEPLFVAVESIEDEATGDYNLNVERVGVDSSNLNRDTSNLDDLPLGVIDTIATIDSLTGMLTTEDLQFIDGDDLYYQDSVLLVEGDVGNEVSVSLDSDFNAELFVDSIDIDGNINSVDIVDDVESAGIEQTTFVIQDNLDYIFTIDTFEPEVTGDYTLTTDVL